MRLFRRIVSKVSINNLGCTGISDRVVNVLTIGPTSMTRTKVMENTMTNGMQNLLQHNQPGADPDYSEICLCRSQISH